MSAFGSGLSICARIICLAQDCLSFNQDLGQDYLFGSGLSVIQSGFWSELSVIL